MEWYESTRQFYQLKNIKPHVFADVKKVLLARGTGNFCNVMTVGPANCGKTFLLKPLKIVFWAFTNPSNNKYAWVAAYQTEVIVLQDFR